MPTAPGRSLIKSAILKSYVNEITDQEEVPAGVTLGENQRVYQCKMAGCNHHVKGKYLEQLVGSNILSVTVPVKK